ncbi:MAG: adenosylmethionine---8-amino-7-oxononanoate aminotransferase [Acidimicrobiaceae bacterium]|nr:adenosylmethionine---8-amino-7-oxononanoate aminotransferase [Acidimicrobiaceae bacterium]
MVWHGFTQMATFADNCPVIVDRAEGHYLIDVAGRRYLDAISSLWVNTLGHRVAELDQAIIDQLGRVAHSTMLGNGNAVVVELAEALSAVVPVADPHFLFAADGAAAVEQAVKMAFQYWVNRGTPRSTYLAFGQAYHGDTVGSLSVGAAGFGTDLFDPLRFPVLRAPGFTSDPDLDTACALIEAHQGELAAVIVEPLVQGAGGMQTAPPSSFHRLGAACRANDVLLIADEVATGFGRTGSLFACEQCDLWPDLLCLGKGITGGYLPMSATVATGRVFDAFLGPPERTFSHGHSYGGNALAAAAALRHLQLLAEWNVLDNVAARAAQLAELLDRQIAADPAVAAIRQRGLMCGVELATPGADSRWGSRVAQACTRRGVLIRPLGDVVVVMPPLTITDDEIRLIIDVLHEAIAEVSHR